jgi:hypothetical protein
MENRPTLPKAIKEYSAESIRSTIKVYLSVLGPLGTAIDELVFGIGERIRGKRLQEFVEILSERINIINKYKIGVEYFQSDDFYDLTVNVINSSVKTNSKLKHEILSEIYIKGINDQIKWEQDLTQTFVRYVNELTPKHILIFKYISQSIVNLTELDSYESLYNIFITQGITQINDKYEFRMYLKDIENKTLLRFSKDINEFGSSGGYIALESYEEVPGVTLTSIGEKFSEYLKK